MLRPWMPRTAMLTCWLLLSVLSLGASAAEPTLDDLSWLVGHWRSESTGRTVEEWWTGAAGGLMLGVNRDHRHGSDGAFFEYLRIEVVDGQLRYVASPRGAGQTVFPLALLETEKAVFENPEHDWPQRMTYSLVEGKLHLAAQGLDPDSRVARWVMTRVE